MGGISDPVIGFRGIMQISAVKGFSAQKPLSHYYPTSGLTSRILTKKIRD